MIENIIKVVMLACIEGVTEFLPVSSTGHLIVGSALLNFDEMGSVFEIFIQFGAVLAVLVYYRKTLLAHLGQYDATASVGRFWILLALGCAPAAATGFVFGRQIEAVLFHPHVIALTLIAGGIMFLLVERWFTSRASVAEPTGEVTRITMRQALTIGIIQILALVPGVSRSGSSIIGGMLAGLNRQLATEFSFYLAIPLLGGATIYKFVTSLDGLMPSQLFLLLVGTVLSGFFAWLAIDWLLRFLKSNSFVIFGYYRIAAGLLILAATSAGWIA